MNRIKVGDDPRRCGQAPAPRKSFDPWAVMAKVLRENPHLREPHRPGMTRP